MIPLTAADLALDTLEGIVNSFVRKHGATIGQVYGQIERAQRDGVPTELVRRRIQRGVSDPPHADPVRVDEIKRRFLSGC
jgi:uncharacterized protein YheU (UPF0270 family)